MTNAYHTVLYTGVTSDLIKRVSEHRSKTVAGFTSKYNVTKLVYYEDHLTMNDAIAREKQIKGGSRQKKLDLIKSMNPDWTDLYQEFFVQPDDHGIVAPRPASEEVSSLPRRGLLRREEHPARNDGCILVMTDTHSSARSANIEDHRLHQASAR
jgi:putative endonuclease